MATDLESELADAFDAVAATLSPPPDLARRARQRVHDQRRRLTRVVVVVALVVAGVGVALIGHGPVTPPKNVTKVLRPSFDVTAANVEAMATRGNILYVAVDAYPGGLLTAYDATTGAELGSAKLAADPNAVAVAADGTVWVTFAALNASRRAGVTQFSPNLGQRSTLLTDDRYLQATTFDVVPIGHGRALVATDHGVLTASLAPPGLRRPVNASATNAPVTVPASRQFGAPTRLVTLSDGDVAVLLSGTGGQSRLVLLHSTASFAGAQMTMAASPAGLWVTTGAGGQPSLQRLSDALAPLPTGAALQTVSLPGAVDRVWTSGRTVWVGTDAGRIRLACFTFASLTDTPSATFSLPASDSAQATDPVVSGDLIIVPTRRAVYVASPFDITSYPVPRACRS
jgi:hypothetical protein